MIEMALSDKQKKINRLTKRLESARWLRDNTIAHRIGEYWEWNNFSVAVRNRDGSTTIIEGFYDGETARYMKNYYRAIHAEKVKQLMTELREVKKSV